MEIITQKIKVFNLDELSEDARQNALNNNREINLDCDEWNSGRIEEFLIDLKKQTNLDIPIDSVFWAVGYRDAKFGVCGNEIIKQLVTEFEDKGVFDIDIPQKIGSFLQHMGGGICNQDTTEKSLAMIYFDKDTPQKTEKTTRDKINKIINAVIDLSYKYHRLNEEDYNNAISDKEVEETIKLNEYKFLESGVMY